MFECIISSIIISTLILFSRYIESMLIDRQNSAKDSKVYIECLNVLFQV